MNSFIFFSLLNLTVHEVLGKMSNGDCCSQRTLSTLVTVYQHTRPFCGHLNLQSICQLGSTGVCKGGDNTAERNKSGDPQTGSDVINMGSDIMKFCNQSESDPLLQNSNFTCEVVEAYEECLAELADQTIDDCR